jgi:hypothetical protein
MVVWTTTEAKLVADSRFTMMRKARQSRRERSKKRFRPPDVNRVLIEEDGFMDPISFLGPIALDFKRNITKEIVQSFF